MAPGLLGLLRPLWQNASPAPKKGLLGEQDPGCEACVLLVPRGTETASSETAKSVSLHSSSAVSH